MAIFKKDDLDILNDAYNNTEPSKGKQTRIISIGEDTITMKMVHGRKNFSLFYIFVSSNNFKLRYCLWAKGFGQLGKHKIRAHGGWAYCVHMAEDDDLTILTTQEAYEADMALLKLVTNKA